MRNMRKNRFRTVLSRLSQSISIPFRINGLVIGGLAGIVMAFLLIRFVNGQIRPVMAELATAQIQNDITLVINHVVAQEIERGQVDHMIRLETNSEGIVTALKSDMAQINLLRANILNALVEAVDHENKLDLAISFGNLTGIDLLSGRGPEIPMRVVTTGSADATFQNEFSAAGINQTCHRIMLNVTVPVRIFMPGYTAKTTVAAQVCIAETIIVGQVPNSYLQLDATQ